MVGYIIMAFISIILIILGYKIYKGNQSLIMEYHQHKVKEEDKKVYGESMGRLLIALGIYNTISYIGTELFIPRYTIYATFTGIILFLVVFVYIQRKYNGGIF